MVIFISKGGQLCNRLWHLTHILAGSREHGYSLTSDTLVEYYHYFSESLDALNSDGGGTRLYQKRDTLGLLFVRGFRLLHRYRKLTRYLPWFTPIHYQRFSWEEGEYYDLGRDQFQKLAKGGFVTLEGWMFIDRAGVRERRGWLQEKLAPNAEIRETCAQFIAQAREGVDVLVGVHIRRGDYIKYYDGVFYYSDAEFKGWMTAVADDLAAAGKTVKFVICSNDKVPLDAYAPLRVQNGPGSEIHDLYTLTGCDYLMGPPSSYSAWASFMGDVPICVIRARTEVVTLSSFGIPGIYPPDGPAWQKE